MFFRSLVYLGGGLPEKMSPGMGLAANYRPAAVTVDAAHTITVPEIAGGLILRSGPTAGRIDTSPTAALMAAAFDGMNIGDSLSFKVSNTSGFSVTLAGGTDVTASGNLIILTLTSREVVLVKTSLTTFDMIAL